MKSLAAYLCLLGLFLGSLPSIAMPPELLKLENEELRTVIAQLRRDNIELKEQLAKQDEVVAHYRLELDKKNKQLIEQQKRIIEIERLLTRETTGVRTIPPTGPNVSATATPVALPKEGHRIVSVNMQFFTVIAAVGKNGGVKLGDKGRILRGSDVVATFSVTLVKPNQCVVKLDRNSLNPQKGAPTGNDVVVFP